jgi:hypothetical protein
MTPLTWPSNRFRRFFISGEYSILHLSLTKPFVIIIPENLPNTSHIPPGPPFSSNEAITVIIRKAYLNINYLNEEDFMLEKLLTLFPSAITVQVPPDTENEDYYWFKDDGDGNLWVGIPKMAITSEQFDLLKTLFHIVEAESPSRLGKSARLWKNFLNGKNETPILPENGVRIIQYHIKSSSGIQRELEEALMEFFHDAAAFIWIDQYYGIVIEENTETGYQEEDFHSIAATLENDFFIKTFFYVGKARQDLSLIKASFQHERHLFFKAQALLFTERVFSFEKVFPSLLASQLPREAGNLLEEDMVRIFREDHELLETMKVFLEHNSNVSLSAKKLYIHRNTLQYRLEKFTEKTGISLKDFNSALTVYFACLMAESPE